MVESGAVLIAAAGNYNDDACLYSPASEPEVRSQWLESIDPWIEIRFRRISLMFDWQLTFYFNLANFCSVFSIQPSIK